jgi:hypothetical protein
MPAKHSISSEFRLLSSKWRLVTQLLGLPLIRSPLPISSYGSSKSLAWPPSEPRPPMPFLEPVRPDPSDQQAPLAADATGPWEAATSPGRVPGWLRIVLGELFDGPVVWECCRCGQVSWGRSNALGLPRSAPVVLGRAYRVTRPARRSCSGSVPRDTLVRPR